jgi:DNA-binding transcriptional regulator LsrR (DeoR family)
VSGMNPRKIKSKLVELGILQTEIARRTGRSKQCINRVINKLDRNKIIEIAIAQEIGYPVEKVFPASSRRAA